MGYTPQLLGLETRVSYCEQLMLRPTTESQQILPDATVEEFVLDCAVIFSMENDSPF